MANAAPVIHIRYNGRSTDIAISDLDLGPQSPDAEVRSRIAGHLDIPENALRDYVIDRHETGNMTVRPEAVFG